MQNKNTEILKPCPFCGSKKINIDSFSFGVKNYIVYIVICSNCKNQTALNNKAKATEKWNTRITDKGKETKMKWYKTPPPTDRKILRFHKIHKCIITVFYAPQNAPKAFPNCIWTTATLDNTWPEEVFTSEWTDDLSV